MGWNSFLDAVFPPHIRPNNPAYVGNKPRTRPRSQGPGSAGEFYSRQPEVMGPPVPKRLSDPIGPPVPDRLKKPARGRTNIPEKTNAEDRQLRQSLGTRGSMPVGSAGTPMPANPVRQNFWEASENAAALEAAQQAGEAANKARLEQKLGYLTSGAGLPATSDPSQDDYWRRADMAIWAKANKELAMKQGWDPNRDYNAPPARTSLAPGEANVAVFDPAGGPAPDPRKEQAAMLNRQVIDKLKTSAGYTPREYEYGGPLEQEDQFRSQYPWTFS